VKNVTDSYPVATHDGHPVATQDGYPVATQDRYPVATHTEPGYPVASPTETGYEADPTPTDDVLPPNNNTDRWDSPEYRWIFQYPLQIPPVKEPKL